LQLTNNASQEDAHVQENEDDFDR